MNNANLPRGIRNNNPGNIRKTGDAWQGQIEFDLEFCQFINPEFGIRAMARILLNYEKHHQLHTIDELILRWAPPEDGNKTASYADFVARRMGIGRDQVINVKPHLFALVRAMIEFENGIQPYDCETISNGIVMAVGEESTN